SPVAPLCLGHRRPHHRLRPGLYYPPRHPHLPEGVEILFHFPSHTGSPNAAVAAGNDGRKP
ncbi:MAG: hypothetical protein P8I59_01755, partial [Pseudomonadales bacterium]|nr:hypothetical protein [Pseudomonadales bacterium]